MRKLSSILLLIAISSHAQIRYDSLSWDQLLKKSKAEDRLIFIHSYASWCEPCDEMENYVFEDLEVGNYYNRNFINTRMDMEQYPGADFAEQWDVAAYPSFLFISAQGEIVHRGCGAMDANALLQMGETAMDGTANLKSYQQKYDDGERSVDLLMNYLALLESVCIDAEKVASRYLASLEENELTSEEGWAVLAAYNWDIYSREFKYLVANQDEFEASIDPKAVQAKIYDTYLSQYQDVFASEELHDFGMRSLLSAVDQQTFLGADTLQLMMQLHYAEFREDWVAYTAYAEKYVTMMRVDDAVELSEIAWKFYLYEEDKTKLETAAVWAKRAVDQLPEPAIIDTYASLLFKLGNRKKAIELESKALEMARSLYDDVSHFEYQLSRFRK